MPPRKAPKVAPKGGKDDLRQPAALGPSDHDQDHDPPSTTKKQAVEPEGSLLSLYKKESSYIFQTYLPKYRQVIHFLAHEDLHGLPNCMLAGPLGVDFDPIWMEAIRQRFQISNITRTPCLSTSKLPYNDGLHFIEIDLYHPDMPKDISHIAGLIKEIITTRAIHQDRHILILQNVDEVRKGAVEMFRVLLERFSNNVFFICTTKSASRLDVSLRSRMVFLRIPLPTRETVQEILTYLVSLCKGWEPYRSLIPDVSCSEIERSILTLEYAAAKRIIITTALSYPPIVNLSKSMSIDDIRDMVTKIVELDIPFASIAHDILITFPQTRPLIPLIADLEHRAAANSCAKEPFFIEFLLMKASALCSHPLLKAFEMLAV